jgi:hypothetical protein
VVPQRRDGVARGDARGALVGRLRGVERRDRAGNRSHGVVALGAPQQRGEPAGGRQPLHHE